MNFRLDEQPWLPVMRDGQACEVSMREALVEAHGIQSLECSNPLQRASILIMLAALVQDMCALKRLARWHEVWDGGRFDPDLVNQYFDAHDDRWDLFCVDKPFMQVAGLESPKGESKPVELLTPEVPTGNNVPLFAVGHESQLAGLSPAEAARAVVACHAWDTAGIKTGAVGDPQMKSGKTTGNRTGLLGSTGFVCLLGRNLFETLMLNVVVASSRDGDMPIWRQPPRTAAWSERMVLGPMDLATFQSRSIRLIPEELEGGEVRVRNAVVTAGDRLLALDRPDLPYTSWHQVKMKKAVETKPKRHLSHKFAFPALPALISAVTEGHGAGVFQHVDAVDLSSEFPLRTLLVGVDYGPQSSSVDHVFSDVLPMPVAALKASGRSMRSLLTHIGRTTEDARKLLDDLHGNLRRAGGGEAFDWDKSQRPSLGLFHELRPAALQVFGHLRENPGGASDVQIAWDMFVFQAVQRSAEAMLQQATPRAFRGSTVQNDRTLRSSDAERFYYASLRKVFPAICDEVFSSKSEGTK